MQQNTHNRNKQTIRCSVLMISLVSLCAMSFLSGCGEEKKRSEFGSKAEDWKKTAPPPEYRGPGQPGGPPQGALNAPPPPPPGADTQAKH